MLIGASQRELSLNKDGHNWRPSTIASELFRRLSGTVVPEGADVWYKGDDGLWWLRIFCAGTSDSRVHVGLFSVDLKLTKLRFTPVRYTTLTGTVRGSWYRQVYVDSSFSRGIQLNVDDLRGSSVAS